MFRPTTIVLALMSGGALVSAAPALMRNDCTQARANHLPNAEDICARRASGGHSSTGWYGHTGSSTSSSSSATRTGAAIGAAVASTSSTSRGGFGAAGAHASAGG